MLKQAAQAVTTASKPCSSAKARFLADSATAISGLTEEIGAVQQQFQSSISTKSMPSAFATAFVDAS